MIHRFNDLSVVAGSLAVSTYSIANLAVVSKLRNLLRVCKQKSSDTTR